MNDISHDIEYFITAHIDGSLSSEEEKVLYDWIHENEANRQRFLELDLLYRQSKSVASPITAEESLAHFMQRAEKTKQPTLRFWIKPLAAAASVLFLLSLSYILFKQSPSATALRTVSIQDSVALEDGTKLYSNNGGQVQFAKAFSAGSQRRIQQLSGNVYYAVAHDKSKPFIIQTPQGNITVVGTAFLVSMQPSFTDITVQEGIVEVSNSNQTIRLVKEEKVRLQPTPLEKEINHDLNFMYWKTHELQYANIRLADVLHDVEQKFKVVIQVQSSISDIKITGRYPVKQVEDLLYILAETAHVRYSKTSDKTYAFEK